MIDTQLPLGVRAIDTLMPCGRGQRMGIFAGSGVGKSTLLSMITRGTEAPVTVLALIGERGREVREFIENDLGPEGLARGRGRVDLRPARARAAARRVHRDAHRRVVPRPAPRRAAPHGQPHPLRDGAARGRAVGRASRRRPAATRRRCSACSPACSSAPAHPTRERHRPLHRARRGRRPHGPDRRRVPRHPRRSHRAVALARDRRATSPASTCSSRSPGSRPRSRHPEQRQAPPRCAGCWPRTATPRTSSRSAPTWPAPARSSIARSHSEKQWMASSDKTYMTSAPHRTRGPRSIVSSEEVAVETLPLPARTGTPRPPSARGHRAAAPCTNREAKTADRRERGSPTTRLTRTSRAARRATTRSIGRQSRLDNAAGAITVARAEYQAALDVVEVRRGMGGPPAGRRVGTARSPPTRRTRHRGSTRRRPTRRRPRRRRHARGAHA